MGRRSSGSGRGGSSAPKPKSKGAPGARIKKVQNYEDTLEEGGVDDFMFKRDQIMFNPQDESDDEDINVNEGQEVLSLNLPSHDNEEDVYEDQEDEEAPVSKERKKKTKADLSTKGRFGKAIPDSDEDESASGSGSGSSDDDDLEGWGRQYYSRPSNRREKEKEDEYDETREEEREMEEREVKRLQRKAREGISGADWGLIEEVGEVPVLLEEVEKRPVPVPETADPTTLIRYMETNEPVKLGLIRDFPLMVRRLEKTARGIQKMEEEKKGEESLHKGLGWLHYQTLLTYATTLAFYIHLISLPPSTRPDMSSHPIIQRLLELKQGVTMLEDLDFAAGSDDGDPLLTAEERAALLAEADEEEDDELVISKKELIQRMLASGYDEKDAEDLWHSQGLEDGELEGLLADREDSESASDEDDEPELSASDEEAVQKIKKVKKVKKRVRVRKPKDEVALVDGHGKREARKKGKKAATSAPTAKTNGFIPLTEPTFVSSRKSTTSAKRPFDDEDTLGDPTSLSEADATDKDRRKKSLRFHTSRIAATSARRAAARAQRLGGDEDLPRRDKKAARDAALRKNGPIGDGGEDLGVGEDETPEVRGKKGKKRDLEEGGDGDGDADDTNGYYELVKRRKTEAKEAKLAEHEALQASKFDAFQDPTSDGPRGLTRAIEKNRGLTPRRSKTSRNPRVKKREAYEKAKRKVASQRAVFKGGQANLGGKYEGEKTGISTKSKSRRF